jgi:hypothetical protein
MKICYIALFGVVQRGSAFLASEMCELEPRSESLIRSLLEGFGREEEEGEGQN